MTVSSFCLILAITVLSPSYRVSPVPCETEALAIEVANWEKPATASRWVMRVGGAWKTPGTYTERFKRSWRWYGRRTQLRFDGVSADFRLTVNGRAEGASQGVRSVVAFDITDALRLWGENTMEITVTKRHRGEGVPMFREVLLVSSHPKAPRELKVKTALSDDFTQATFRVVDEQGAVLKERQVGKPQLWSPEYPAVCLTPIASSFGWWKFRQTEYRAVKFAFRAVEHKGGRYWLNGKPLALKAVAAHRLTPGYQGRGDTVQRMVQDVVFVRGLNANAVFASDYPLCEDWYGLCDRDGLMVLTRDGDVAPEGHPCVLPIGKDAVVAHAIGDTSADLQRLKEFFSPLRLKGYDWKHNTLTLVNGFDFIDLEALDGLAWTAYDADGKIAAHSAVTPLKGGPGKTVVVAFEGVKGERIVVDILRDGDCIVRAEYKKGK